MILDIAIRHFAERGYASTSLTAIATDAGLATSAVYHYFDGKEQLYESVFFAVAPAVWQQMADSVRDAPTMLAAIAALMRDRGGARGTIRQLVPCGDANGRHIAPGVPAPPRRGGPRSRTRCSERWPISGCETAS